MFGRHSQGTGFTRRVDPIERWFHGFPTSMSPVQNLCVEGLGRLDVGALRRAVAAASEACPGARLVRRGRMWVDGGADPAVRLVRGRALDPRALHDVPELRSPLPGRSGGRLRGGGVRRPRADRGAPGEPRGDGRTRADPVGA